VKKLNSKFSDIVKIRQLKVDEIERDIQGQYGAIKLLQNDIAIIEKQILESKPPSAGEFAMVQLYHQGISNMNGEIHRLETRIREHLQAIENLKVSLRSANMEVEKFKYLHDDEVEKQKQELKRQEQKDLDELAVLRFSFKR
jgi:flagellar export protein FliJ